MPGPRRAVLFLAILSLVIALPAFSDEPVRKEIHFPNIPGCQTLVCDFHMHTVFSDGLVWPTVRVNEAWREGLDAMAITDHVEYQPHKADVPTQHNRSFELATGKAKEFGLLLTKAVEITRDTPPGHFNALFLSDAAALETPDFLDAIRRANEQGAFVFWNHQAWQGEEKGKWLDVHTTLYDNKLLHGMEVCNGESYYPNAHQWCLDKNLTMLGNSDIHDPDLRPASAPADHRTMTLVFVKEPTLDGLKEALREGRTAVWYKDQLIGRQQWLEPLFAAGVEFNPPHHRAGKNVLLKVANRLDCEIQLDRTGPVGPPQITLPACATILLRVTLPDPAQSAKLEYTAKNLLIAPGKGLPMTHEIPAP
jgi:hypothetical protein